jgi:hypothetical protein
MGSGKNIDDKKHGKIEAALDVAVALIKDHIACNNNDCKCREGYGICTQCTDSATRFLESLEELGMDINPLKTTSEHNGGYK